MIESKSNEGIREILLLQKKARARQKAGCFVAEGLRMVAETPNELLVRIYVSSSFLRQHEREERFLGLCQRLRQERREDCMYEVSDALMREISDTVTPQGIVALVRQPSYEMEDLMAGERSLLLILENLQDPGNLGTILRTAEGAGVTGLILSKDCVDLFSPKVIRSTMGALYRIPFVQREDLSEIIQALKEEGVRFYAAHLGGHKNYDQTDYRGASGFLIGNEGSGLREETAALADERILIPMAGQLESLNAAMAAGILVYEAARQRRGDS